MSSVPAKRLLVYAALGLVVLIVGVVAVLSMAGGQAGSGDAVELSQGGEASPDSGSGATSTSGSVTTTTKAMFVQVAGAVGRPGVYQMPAGSRVFEAVEAAGGFAGGADQEAMSLAAVVSDGCRVYVPRKGEVVVSTTSSGAKARQGSPTATGSDGPISINSATLEELDALPGVGPSTAQNIIKYRETNGPFTSIDQLGDVTGIGPSKLEQMRPLIGL